MKAPASALLNELGATLRAVAQREIVPRFQRLAASDVISKPSPDDADDLVTAADHAVEAALCECLPKLVSGSVVLGEEAVAADRELLKLLRGSAPVWLVDPVDGTKNFAAGHGPYATMVALVEQGELLVSGIYFPEGDRLFLAERGAGAFLNGNAIRPEMRSDNLPIGTVYARFMPKDQAVVIAERAVKHQQVPGVTCAAHEYTETALGRKDYVVFYRLLPWDHAPGALILREAGGIVRHPDGREYSVFDEREVTLLASDLQGWETLRAELFCDQRQALRATSRSEN